MTLLATGKLQPKRGEVWSVQTEKGLKDCIIISNDRGNKFSEIVLAVDYIQGQKRKPTQMQVGERVALFEKVSTYAHERLVQRVDKVSKEMESRFGVYIEAVSKQIKKTSPVPTTVQQWGFYFIDLGEGVGSEQAGMRLVVVASNDILNATGKITVVPATSQLKRSIPTHVNVPSSIGIPYDSTLMLEQLVTVSSSLFKGTNKVADLPIEYRSKVLDAMEVATAYDVNKVMEKVNRK